MQSKTVQYTIRSENVVNGPEPWQNDENELRDISSVERNSSLSQLVEISMRSLYQHDEPQEIHFNDEITQFSPLSTTTWCHCLICYCVMTMISSCGFRRQIITICQHRNYQFRKEMAKQSSVRQDERCEFKFNVPYYEILRTCHRTPPWNVCVPAFAHRK